MKTKDTVVIIRGAHGDFDSRAMNFSPQFWFMTHLQTLEVAAAGLKGLVYYFLLKKKSLFSKFAIGDTYEQIYKIRT